MSQTILTYLQCIFYLTEDVIIPVSTRKVDRTSDFVCTTVFLSKQGIAMTSERSCFGVPNAITQVKQYSKVMDMSAPFRSSVLLTSSELSSQRSLARLGAHSW